MKNPRSEFLGYRRPDGSVGVRNHLLVLSTAGVTGPTARRVGRALPGARVVSSGYGAGLLPADEALHARVMLGFALNPNVGAVVLLGSDPPKLAKLAAEVEASGKPFAAVCLDDCQHDALTLTDRAIRAGARLTREISRLRREPVPISELFLGLECGRSDPSSGMIANPLVGKVTDALVGAGGSAVFGETMEWLGAEHLLTPRATSPDIAEAIVAAVRRRENEAIKNGIDLLGNNPTPTNIAGGLSTIEEKSLGAIAKSGSGPIAGVLQVAERPAGKGLYAMDAPAFAPESVTGLITSGAQVVLFTTGAGNSYVSTLAPTIKISGNPGATAVLHEQIDFDAAPVFQGRESLESAAERLLDLTIDVASGTLTWGEILDEGDEVISRMGEAL